MCGIVGYVGSKNAVNVLISGLSKLEYRGYDSAGISLLNNDTIATYKKEGKLENLKHHISSMNLESNTGIGHTRWATHGGVSDQNAHPHQSSDGKITLVHNGIFENYLESRERLVFMGHKFESQTDTEVLVHLIEEEYKRMRENNPKSPELFVKAVRHALLQVKGGYAIVTFHADFPQHIVAARMHNPLIVGFGKNENLIASDVPALLDYTNTVMDLKNEEIVHITPDSVILTNLAGKNVVIKTREVHWDAKTAEKGGYPHFMLKEIHETPDIIEQLLIGRIENNEISLQSLGIANIDFKAINKITFIACGSAAYAAQYAKYLIEKFARITTEVVVGSEYRYHEPVITNRTLIIAVSQSGETADTLASIEKAREGSPAKIIGLINAVGSSMTRVVDEVCLLKAGPEISVCATKSFTSMIVNLALISVAIGQANGNIDKSMLQSIIQEFVSLPDTLRKVLQTENDIARISTYFIHKQSAYYIGRDVNFPAALEGAQKLKEISYIHAEAYPAGELKHGPNAVIDEGFPVIGIVPKSHVYHKMISNIQQMKARNALVLAIGTQGNTSLSEHADHILYVPETSEYLSTIPISFLLQIFAYYVTLYKGYSIDNPHGLQKSFPEPGNITDIPKSIDIDKPRNLAKSVTVE